MSVFDDLASAMDGLVGAGMGGWVLGAIIVFALIFPLALAMFMSKGAGSSATMLVFMVSAFGVVFNVGVGWWDPWAVVFIAVIILFAWWVSKNAGDGGGI